MAVDRKKELQRRKQWT